MACLPPRYKLVELFCYIVMGFFPALVILSMVSSTHPARGDSRDCPVRPPPLAHGEGEA